MLSVVFRRYRAKVPDAWQSAKAVDGRSHAAPAPARGASLAPTSERPGIEPLFDCLFISVFTYLRDCYNMAACTASRRSPIRPGGASSRCSPRANSRPARSRGASTCPRPPSRSTSSCCATPGSSRCGATRNAASTRSTRAGSRSSTLGSRASAASADTISSFPADERGLLHVGLRIDLFDVPAGARDQLSQVLRMIRAEDARKGEVTFAILVDAVVGEGGEI